MQFSSIQCTFPLTFGILLMQAIQLPRKMMEWMRLTFVHCAPNRTLPYFVVSKKNVVLSVLTHTFVHMCGKNCLLGGRLKRSARVVQLFGRLAVLETHTLRY